MAPGEKNMLNRKRNLAGALILVLIVSLIGVVPVAAQWGTTWYVSTTGNDLHSCSVPASPCATINGAIGKATDGDTLLVAQGTYTNPNSGGLPVVHVSKSLTITGGWDNSFSTQIGYSEIDGQNTYQGIYVGSGSGTVTASMERFSIQNGFSGDGGGIYLSGNLTLINSSVQNNVATGYAGGIYAWGGLNLIDSTVSQNSAAYRGGGIYHPASNNAITLSNSTLSDNTAISGGGMYNEEGSITLTNVTVRNNSATWGGGMYNYLSSPTLTDVTFSNNSGLGEGGGMVNDGGASPSITNAAFINNAADSGGGIFNADFSNPSLTNVTFNNNTAVRGGGAIFNYASSPRLIHVTMHNNSAGNSSGGGIYNYAIYSNPTLINTIVWGNIGGEIVNSFNGSSIVSYSIIQGGYAGGTNIITSDPNLGPLANNGGFTLTMALLPGSPAIDAGDDANCPATDQRGVTRPQGAHCDIGAYEYEGPFGDTVPPTVVSVTRADANPTLAPEVDFQVTFSEDVTGVDASDFSLTANGVSGATVNAVSGSGSVYTVTVSTGSGAGTIRLDVADNDSILDAASNPLGGAGTGNGIFNQGESYTIPQILTLNLSSVAANDGSILESSENSSVGGSLNATASTFQVGDEKANRQYVGILHFDTSSLPDNAVITSVTLQVRKQAVTGSDPFTTHGSLVLDVQKTYFGTTAGLSVDDFQATAGGAMVSTFDPTPVNNWYSAAIGSAGHVYLDLTGTTQFRLRFTLDDDNDRSADSVNFYSGETASVKGGITTNRPQLIIQYYIP